MKIRKKRAITLVELLVAIFLLSMVVLTGVTVELAMRRMQTKPTVQVKLLDELIPVMDMIKKDFETQIGTWDNASFSIEESGRRVVIRVDNGTSPGQLDPNDPWHAYRWSGTPGTDESHPIEYYEDNSSSNYEIIAEGITYFNVSAAYDNTALRIIIQTKKIPEEDEDPINNPAVNLTSTIFSRMTSAR